MHTIPDGVIEAQVTQALAEDIGEGDLTAMLVPADKQIQADVLCREPAILCGQSWFNRVFSKLDKDIEITWNKADGDEIEAGDIICQLKGPARTILTGERSALNFLQTLSATATATHQFVLALAGTSCRILDTRKTIPGYRLAQKYAVKCGGGENHRFGLYDMILIKENHIIAAGSIAAAVAKARQQGPGIDIEVEVENLDELQQALQCDIRRVLLDNMNNEMLKQAVEMNAGRLELEASGNVELDTVAEIAATGVDYISTGAITKHIHAIDFSMRFTDS